MKGASELRSEEMSWRQNSSVTGIKKRVILMNL